MSSPSRHFALSDPEGNFQISHVPAGHYQLSVRYELASAPELESLSREVDIGRGGNQLPRIALHSSDAPKPHANKNGEPH